MDFRMVIAVVLGAVPLLGCLLWWWNDLLYGLPAKIRCSRDGTKLPPGHMGIPFLGEMFTFLWYFKFLRCPDDFINSKRYKYGDGVGMYRTHLLGSPGIIACSPAVTKFVFQSERDGKFGMDWPSLEIIGHNSLIALNGPAHGRLRNFVTKAINQPDALKPIALMVQPRVISSLQSWAVKGRIIAYDEVRKVTFENIGKFFASIEPGPILDTLNNLFKGMLHGVRAYPINIPGTAYNHGLQCRKRVLATFREELEKRKRKYKDGAKAMDDLMDGLLQSQDEEGKHLSDDEVLDNIIGFVVAGYESTSLTIMWTLYYLAKYPNELQKLREENMPISKSKNGELITFAELSKLKYTNKVVEETIRMANVSAFVFRKANEDVEFKGYKFPKGWKVMLWIRYLHTDSDNFKAPFCFNPDRWNEPAKPGTYQVFGGGPRICPGNMLARMQVAIFLHYLVVGYNFYPLRPNTICTRGDREAWRSRRWRLRSGSRKQRFSEGPCTLASMAENLLRIADITPQTPRPWSCKVTVVEKGFPRDPTTNPTKYQRLILLDSHDTRTQATIFGTDIAEMEDTLTFMKQYIITSAIVKTIDKQHRLVPHPFQWILSGRTKIEPVVDNILPLQPAFNLVPFNRIAQFRTSSTLIDVIGAVVRVREPRNQPTPNGLTQIQEMLLMNREFETMMLSLWNRYVEGEGVAITALVKTMPVILGLKLKAVSFNEVSLSSRSPTCIILNPVLPQAAELQSILIENPDKVVAAIALSKFEAQRSLSAAVKKEAISLISLEEVPNNQTVVVDCTITPINLDRKMWYMGCSNCYRSTTASYMERFTCHGRNCSTKKDTHGFPRARIDVILKDPSAEAKVTFFGTDAERILGCRAVLMCEAELQLGNAGPPQINLINQETEHKIYLRGSDYYISGGKTRKYTASFPPPINSNDNVMQNLVPDIIGDNTGMLQTGTPSVVAESSTISSSSSPSSLKMTTTSMHANEEVILWKGKSKITNEDNTMA